MKSRSKERHKRMHRIPTSLILTLAVALQAVAGNVTIIGHRGASGHAPENTLASFKKAVEAKADYFELDCHLTRDNEVVISHDGDLERTASEKVSIANMTLAEIETKEVGGWFAPEFKGEKLPTLAQALAASSPECGVYVEIKSEKGDSAASRALMARASGQKKLTRKLKHDLMELANAAETRSTALTRATIAEIRAANMEKRVVIQSFSPLICFVARCEAPDLRTELLISEDKDDPSLFPRLVDFGMLLNVAGFNANKDSLTPERLKTFHDAKKTVAVWTLNEPQDFRRFADMGVDAIITNYPAECRAFLGAEH